MGLLGGICAVIHLDTGDILSEHQIDPQLLAKPAHTTWPMAPEMTDVSRRMRHMSRDITWWS